MPERLAVAGAATNSLLVEYSGEKGGLRWKIRNSALRG
jgi:hypothetical protein